MIPTNSTNINGPIAVIGESDDMIGIDCKTADIR